MNKHELEDRLKRERFSADAYRLDGSLPGYSGFYIKHFGRTWQVLYYERGLEQDFGSYDSEEAACDRLYALLEADPTTRMNFSSR